MTQTTQAVKLMPPDVKIDMKDHSADAPQGQQDMMREVKNDKKNVLSKFNRGFADRLETAVANGANRPAGTGAPAANALTQKAAESWLEYFKSLARKYNLPAPVNFALNALGFVVIVGGCIFEVRANTRTAIVPICGCGFAQIRASCVFPSVGVCCL
jgi:hypothetical protein